MKRDMDLIRKLLIQIEGEEPVDLENYSETQIAYHRRLLIESGLVIGIIAETRDGLDFVGEERLTWDGHEFLEKIRNETIWNDAKQSFVDKGVGISLSVLQTVLAKITLAYLGMP